jgi:hypothetical protein
MEYITFDSYLNLDFSIPEKTSQIQIKFFKLNGDYIDLNFELDDNLKLKNIIEKAIDYLDEDKYIKSFIYLNRIHDKNNTNESNLYQSLLYNSIEIIEFNQEHKIINIYKTDYSNAMKNDEKENNKNMEIFDEFKLSQLYNNNNNSEIALYEKPIQKGVIYIYIYPIKIKEVNKFFNTSIEYIILSYPIIISINSDANIENLQSIIFEKLKKIINDGDKSSIEICIPHFMDNWGIFNQNKNYECNICKKNIQITVIIAIYSNFLINMTKYQN